MENIEEKGNIFEADQYKDKVHLVLARSYAVYLILFIAGALLQLIFNLKAFSFSLMVPIGVVLILLATSLIFWAQRTSRNLKKDTLTKETFMKGPYRFTRSPTHWGLFFLTLGFGLLCGTIFIIITTFVSLFLTKFIYLKKEEDILLRKYGVPYEEYKQAVKL
jgi:protein-S-isoprenylcysteine O-methyltransferase Ste14